MIAGGTSGSTSVAALLEPGKLFDVRGVVAVVTGGGSGIGLMAATALENNGAIVYIVGRRKHVLEKAAKDNNKYGNIIPLVGDVTNRESLLSIVDAIKTRSGHVNFLVNNAGVAHNILPPVPASSHSGDIKSFQKRLWDAGTPEEFTDTFNTNVTAVYYTTVAFLELLHLGNARRASADAPTSQVVVMSSGAGYRRDEKVYSVSYGLSKTAATHLGKMFANMLSGYRIRSNVIAPGIFPTDMINGLLPDGPARPDSVPLERYGSIEDMAGLILYLASRAGAYSNGGVFLNDGGRLCLFPSSY